MDIFKEYLAGIDEPKRRERVKEILTWVAESFPDLAPRVAWNQPMFTHHGTFIIGFSVSKQHMAVSPEIAGIERFSADIVQAGYDHSQMLFRIRWDKPVDYPLLQKIIEFNISDKAECASFWRKA